MFIYLSFNFGFVNTNRDYDSKPNFFKQYHSAVIKALGEDAKKVNAKVGSIFTDNWTNNAGSFNDNTEFARSFESYLKYQLEFAKEVRVNCDEKNHTLDIKGCAICHGNEMLRKEGIPTACPIVQAAKYAAVKKMGRNIITKGVEKPGTVGECTIRFELEQLISPQSLAATILVPLRSGMKKSTTNSYELIRTQATGVRTSSY